jgi:hypothetical protein
MNNRVDTVSDELPFKPGHSRTGVQPV